MKYTYMPCTHMWAREIEMSLIHFIKAGNLIFRQVNFAYMLDLDSLGFNVKVFLMSNNLYFVAVYIFENSFFLLLS